MHVSKAADLRLLLAFTLGFVAVAAIRPAASYQAIALGGSAIDVGVVGGAFGFLSMLAALPIGMRVDRYGDRPFFILGSAFIVAAAVVDFVAGSIGMLILAQAMLGLGQVSVSVAIQARTANADPPPSSDERFARLAVASAIGQLIGPIVAGVAIGLDAEGRHVTGIAIAFALSTVIGIVALLVALLPEPEGWRRTGGRPAVIKGAVILDLLRRPGAQPSLAASVAVASTVDVLVAYLPLLGDANGLQPAFIGSLLAVRSGAGLVSRVLLTPMLRRLGRQRVLTVTLLISGLAMVGLAIVPVEIVMLCMVFLVGFGLGVGQPLTQSWSADMAAADERGASLAIRVAANRLAQLVLPPALGVVGVVTGLVGIFVVGAGTLVGSAVLVERFEEPAAVPLDPATRAGREV